MTDTERDILGGLAEAIWSQHPLCKPGRRPKWADKAAVAAWRYIKARLESEAEREAVDEAQIRRFT